MSSDNKPMPLSGGEWIIVRCPHCNWWSFVVGDALGPRDAERAFQAHVVASHDVPVRPSLPPPELNPFKLVG